MYDNCTVLYFRLLYINNAVVMYLSLFFAVSDCNFYSCKLLIVIINYNIMKLEGNLVRLGARGS